VPYTKPTPTRAPVRESVAAVTAGIREYQVRVCNVAGCSGYSGVKTASVSAPADDYDGA